MNELIKKQLESCRVANIPPFSDDDTQIVITRGQVSSVSPYQVHKCYVIELADYILNPPPNFTLADNWNKGSIPKYKYYKCEISAVMGNMVKISGCGYDNASDSDYNEFWEGWLPQSGVKLIKELR